MTQRAIEQIKAMIGEGRLEPGQRLPTERDLAAQLGISRSSMREAIRALTVLGRAGGPARLGHLRHAAGGRGPAGDLRCGRRSVPRAALVELLEVRRILESTATALAAARITAGPAGRGREAPRGDERHRRPGGDPRPRPGLPPRDRGGRRATTRWPRSWRASPPAPSAPGCGAATRRRAPSTAPAASTPAIHRALVARDPEAARAAAAAHVGEVEEWLRSQVGDGIR